MQVNKIAEIHGLILDPLKVDTLAKNIHPIVDISVSNLLLSANLKMWDIQMHGLSTIYTNNILVTRAKNLFDIDFEVEVKFSQFYLNGTYNMDGSIGGWLGTSFSSHGDQSFFVDIDEATLKIGVRLDTSNENMCGKIGDVLIRDIGIPFTYNGISIYMAGFKDDKVISGLSSIIFQMQETRLTSLIKDAIRVALPRLIC